MKKIAVILVLLLCSFSASSQKLNEPILLGSFIAGEDPSEFLLHRVMEESERLLEENPEGKLIVRICSSGDFSTAFVKAPLDPVAASRYNLFTKRIIVPYEKMFIANSSKCFEKEKFVYNQYWFVPNDNKIEYDEIFPVESISYKVFYVEDYDYETNKQKTFESQNKEFTKNVSDFINELKNNPKSEGFIVHNSKNKRMKRNIEKVYNILKRENINLQRVRTIIRITLDSDKNGELKPVKDEKQSLPVLKILVIKNKIL